jgi:hypothetical protein
LFAGSIFLRAFTRLILIRKLHIDNVFTRTLFFDTVVLKEDEDRVTIKWAKLYPFNGISDAVNNAVEDKASRLKRRIVTIENAIEKYAGENLVNRNKFAEWAIKYEKSIGWNFLNGGVVDLGGGYLSETGERHDTSAYAAALAELYGFLQGSGIDFLYVQNPLKIAPDDPISGTRDFSNQNADDLLDALSLMRIPYLDLRENIREEGLDHHALFYKTDHHWKVETGLWASGVLLNYLSKNYRFGFDPGLINPQAYSYVLYKDWFLGSLGKKVTLAQTPAEDFTLITPQFDTDFSLAIPELNLNVRGNFDIFIDHFKIDIKDYYGINTYGAYMAGGSQVITVHNYFAPNDKKIILIRDSFAQVVAPFLSVGVGDLHILDLRYYTGSVRSYLEKNKPDMVIVMYYPVVLDGEHEKMFDFR